MTSLSAFYATLRPSLQASPSLREGLRDLGGKMNAPGVNSTFNIHGRHMEKTFTINIMQGGERIHQSTIDLVMKFEKSIPLMCSAVSASTMSNLAPRRSSSRCFRNLVADRSCPTCTKDTERSSSLFILLAASRITRSTV